MAYEDLGFVPEPKDDLGFILDAPAKQWVDAAPPPTNPDERAALERVKRASEAGQTLTVYPPRASQADVRKAEPRPSPMQSQQEKEERFAEAMKRFTAETGGALKPGQNIRQAVEEWSGIQDPAKTIGQAETDEIASGGRVPYGDSVPYAGAKVLAAMGGAIVGGRAGLPGGIGGATAAEAMVRRAALEYSRVAGNLKRAVDAGAITEERAAELIFQEMARGMGEDLAFNLAVPVLGRIAMMVPGVPWLANKVAARFGLPAPQTAADRLAEQRKKKTDNLVAKAETPAAAEAVRELGQRTEQSGAIPTPGQVTGEVSWGEKITRKASPHPFGKQNEVLDEAVEGMRQDAFGVNLGGLSERKALGQAVIDMAEATEKAVKTRLRPVFKDADALGVKIDFSDVLARAKAALAADGKVPGSRLEPIEKAVLGEIIRDLENLAKPAVPAGEAPVGGLVDVGGRAIMRPTPAQAAEPPMVGAEDALDFISRQKERLRSATATYRPSEYFNILVRDLQESADVAYAGGALSAGRGDIASALNTAREEYRGMMETVYKGVVEKALRKELVPEDIGRLIWQVGNVSEPQQLNALMRMAIKEGAVSGAAAGKMQADLTKGFLQEAVPTIGAAARWSETLTAKPGLRDTWLTLTATPGGAQLRGSMEVLEQAAKIAGRNSSELLRHEVIPIAAQRIAGGSLGVSNVSLKPGWIATGLSLTGLTRLMATAYTQGNRGMLNTVMRALRANSAGTAAGAKALQAALPEIEKFAAENGITDVFVGERRE